MTRPKVLAIIPARGGSKRLPRKNIALLCEKPLITYTIEAALEARLLTDFLVSSDDQEIIDIAKNAGASAPFIRPATLGADHVRNIDVALHALTYMESESKTTYDLVFLLQPTSPIRNPKHIDECIELLWNSELDSIVSVKGPFQKRDPILKRILPSGALANYRDSGLNNDPTEPFYLYNASIYGVKRDFFLSSHAFISQLQVPYIMDFAHSIDIDNNEDLLLANFFLSLRN
jgi:CMP-N,N'-diacetyllegionaminic acid synthase